MELDSGQNFGMANLSMEFLVRNKDSNMGNYYGYQLEGHMQNTDSMYHTPSFFFHNFAKASSRSELQFMIPNQIHNNIKRKFENFTKYIASKENHFTKESEQWSEMSSGYSEFIASPRGYSYVSNSIASYLIGGFVGSKSQMNSEKPKLSYDLGEVIKILHDYKCDKSFDKPREEKRFDFLNKNGKKAKSSFKDFDDVAEQNACNIALCKDLNIKATDRSGTVNEDANFPKLISDYLDSSPKATNQSAEQNVEYGAAAGEIVEKATSSKVTQPQATCDNHSCSINSDKNNEQSVDVMISDDVKDTKSPTLCVAEMCSFDVSKKNENNVNNMNRFSKSKANNNNNNNNIVSNMNYLGENCLHGSKSRNATGNKCKEPSEADAEKKLSGSTTIPCAYANRTPTSSRIRQLSECSIDSTDSESFIVFDDAYCDGSVDQLDNQILHESENDFSESDSDSNSEDDSSIDEDDDDDDDDDFEDIDCYCDDSDEDDSSHSATIRNGNEYDVEFDDDDEVAWANARWSESYKNVSVSDVEESERKVRFSPKIEVHRMIAWDFAYRAARIGPWEQMVRDRLRFRERIHRLAPVISPVLAETHRKSIYNKMFVD